MPGSTRERPATLAEPPREETPATPSARPAAADLAQAAALVAEASAPEADRLVAAERLLHSDYHRLVTAYANRGTVPIIRQLIEARIAAGDSAVLPLVVDLFETRGGEERIDFQVYLQSLGPAAEAELVRMLSSSDPSLVMRATDTLAKMKAVHAAAEVASLLRHPESWVRMGAAHALGELAGPGTVDALVAALDDTAYAVVNAGLVALGRLRAPALFEPAMGLVGDDNPHIRKHAAMALGELGDGRAREALHQLSEHDGDAGVRFMAGRALERLDRSR